MYRFRILPLLLCLLAITAWAQQTGIIKGTVTDNTGAVIPGANVTLVVPGGEPKNITTNENGGYSFPGVASGKYTVRATAIGFGSFEKEVDLAPSGVVTLDAPLAVTLAKQEVTVEGASTTTVGVDPTQNAGQIVLRGQDLEALSDDPDALAADLQALAGPSAGPNGGQIYVDGFSGAKLPPKESIREIRINSNPFSAEYDRLGMGRIEIFTKPGSDKYHGQAMFNFSDDVLNSRNPFANTRPPYQSRQSGVSFGGPLSKKSSFFSDFEKRDIDDNAIISATILDSNLNPTALGVGLVTPNRRTSFSQRLDYALSTNNTLVGRYHFSKSDDENSGVGLFNLQSRGYNTSNLDHTAQITETSILGPTLINETRFQFIHRNADVYGDASVPALSVLGAFNGGGAQVGRSSTLEKRYELTNTTSWAHKTHSFKFGGRLRASNYEDVSPRNFGGSFTFSGGQLPLLDNNFQPVLDASGQTVTAKVSSIDQYRTTLLLGQRGLTPSQIRGLGYGASQFSISGGNPLAAIDQVDGAIFVQDDWRTRPNLTLSLGLRYEMQNNVSDWGNIAPRIGVAWAPGSKGGKPGKTVVRAGFGMFYDRIDDALTLSTLRFNGVSQQQFVVREPDFYPNIPSLASLTNSAVPQTIQTKSPTLRASYLMQSVFGIERQLPRNTTLSFTYTNTRGLHLLRSINLRATNPALSTNVYQYDSSGVLNQNQFITNLNTRVTSKISLFTFYVLGYAKGDTDGTGSFPADPYNWRSEYGRSRLDTRHRFVLGGSITAPWNLRFSPFIIARTGSPFDITTGTDLNRDQIFNDRPALVSASTPGAVVTKYGAFLTNPAAGQPIIERNFAEGPGYFSVNLRMSKTFGFGGVRKSSAVNSAGGGGGDFGGGRGGPGGGGMRGGGGGGGMRGGGGMGGGGMRGMGGMDGGGSSEQRFSVTLMANARNLFNTVNLSTPIGNLTSPQFGLSNSLAGGFGPGSEANNRKIEFGLRFSF